MSVSALHRLRRKALLAISLGAAMFAGGAAAESATATTVCNLVASPSGSDSNPGTVAAPLLSPHKLVDSLSNGQVGCFRGGTYTFTSYRLRIDRPGVQLTSYPGERATLVGRIWVSSGAQGAKITSLNLDGRNTDDLPSPTVSAKDTVWRGLDVTNGHDRTSCFLLGPVGYGAAENTLIADSRIHNCGELPATNLDHGIYAAQASGTVITNNAIYDNADRGVNLYPGGQRVSVVSNVIDGNGEGVMFAGSSSASSSQTRVAQNIISNSKQRWNIESYWAGRVGTQNVAEQNCVFASSQRSYYNERGGVASPVGFVATLNRVANPLFVDRSAKNFALAPGSGCKGFGPTTASGVTSFRRR